MYAAVLQQRAGDTQMHLNDTFTLLYATYEYDYVRYFAIQINNKFVFTHTSLSGSRLTPHYDTRNDCSSFSTHSKLRKH